MAHTVRALIALVVLPVFGWGQSLPGEILDSLVVEALRNNPLVLAESERLQASLERESQAGTLDPPQFIYKLMEFPGTEFSQARFQNFGLMQNIPFPTKLGRESDIARSASAQAALQERANILDVISRVRSTAAALWGTRTLLQISRENQRLLRQIVSAAQTRYSVGQTSQQDVLKADIELVRLESQEIDFEQQVASREAELRALLNRSNSQPIGTLDEPHPSPVTASVEQLLAVARQRSPELATDSVRIQQATDELALSKDMYYPDLSLEVERVTMPIGGPSSWTVMATVSLPFAPWTLGRMSAGVQEARAQQAESRSRYINTTTALESRVRTRYARTRALYYQLEAYRDRIVPRTAQSVQSLLTAYQTGVTDFLMLMDGYRTYHDARMELTRITADYQQATAELAREIGVSTLTDTPEEKP